MFQTSEQDALQRFCIYRILHQCDEAPWFFRYLWNSYWFSCFEAVWIYGWIAVFRNDRLYLHHYYDALTCNQNMIGLWNNKVNIKWTHCTQYTCVNIEKYTKHWTQRGYTAIGQYRAALTGQQRGQPLRLLTDCWCCSCDREKFAFSFLFCFCRASYNQSVQIGTVSWV